MKPKEALGILGTSRVIWIDDHFSENSAEQLAELLSLNLEVSLNCGLDDYEGLLNRIQNEDDSASVELIEKLIDAPADELRMIEQKYQQYQARAGAFQTKDLSQQHIDMLLEQLSIERDDCWSFVNIEQKIDSLCDNDAHISYIVDLNDANGARGNMRGLDIIKMLSDKKSKCTTFLLTHEADIDSEARTEGELRQKLLKDMQCQSAPVCVIAKERFIGDKSDDAVSEGLCIAIKRAGLQRSIHNVLLRAEADVVTAFQTAKSSLLLVPPEQLDEYVVRRAVAEGVSELHVIERALTATMSESLRRLFASDNDVLENAKRLRALHGISLNAKQSDPHPELKEFRKKELWEPRELVNGSLAALACGDVFKLYENNSGGGECLLILLAQPCDVMIRANGRRDAETGLFIPLKWKDPKGNGKATLKKPLLPFSVDGKEWFCDFRGATSVKLSILDLATFRSDGMVRYDNNQTLPDGVLPGQKSNGEDVLRELTAALIDATQSQNHGANDKNRYDRRCLLTFTDKKAPFSKIAHPKYDASGFLTWNLQRYGRVRMPYAASLLNTYLSVMGREAFDLDYLRPTAEPKKD